MPNLSPEQYEAYRQKSWAKVAALEAAVLDRQKSPPRREADLHEAILAECKRRGWPVVHGRMDRPATVGIGTPDFVVALDGARTLWVEAKAGGAKLRPEQLAWMAALRRVGHHTAVVRSLDDFLSAVLSTNPKFL